ncbi:hypothetical protein CRUP_036511 [Coryphaenoides rupestris]|nr:hypothetical protein CRUP_036511 [Coryphaenoides rupestris]
MGVDHTLFKIIGLLFVAATTPTHADCQENLIEACQQFVYMNRLPQGLQGPPFQCICQRYNGKARFVTLYDTLNRTPVYSAYTFKRSTGGSARVDVPWMYEPQLSINVGSREMQPLPQTDLPLTHGDAQAVLEDYRDTVDVVRGQLCPDTHQMEFDDKAATYTLTNVVPQVREFVEGPWAAQENAVRQRLNNYCHGTAYVVTGAVARKATVRRHDRVAVPDYVWSAYCCVDYDCRAPYPEFSKFPAFASVGRNTKLDNDVKEMSVQKLEDIIMDATGYTLKIFYDNCELNHVVLSWVWFLMLVSILSTSRIAMVA